MTKSHILFVAKNLTLSYCESDIKLNNTERQIKN